MGTAIVSKWLSWCNASSMLHDASFCAMHYVNVQPASRYCCIFSFFLFVLGRCAVFFFLRLLHSLFYYIPLLACVHLL